MLMVCVNRCRAQLCSFDHRSRDMRCWCSWTVLWLVYHYCRSGTLSRSTQVQRFDGRSIWSRQCRRPVDRRCFYQPRLMALVVRCSQVQKLLEALADSFTASTSTFPWAVYPASSSSSSSQTNHPKLALTGVACFAHSMCSV